MIRPTSTGIELDVRVIPRARRTEIFGTRDNALLVRIAAPPVEGAANDALIDLLAATCRVPRRSIRLVSGESSRHKRIAIDGVTPDQIRAAIVK
jgi:uncharacterized protein (TIGR00251 family)